MAGHSKFKNIMHRKGAQDAKRAKRFARLTKELQVAVRGGTDPSSNPRLRSALAACRSVNMPKDNIERVIKKAETGQSSNLEEIRYEGYASSGIALIVDAVTDNRNRTAAEVRSSFTKYGGTLGETGSVSFMFNNIGQIIYNKNVKSDEDIFEIAIDVGADDVNSDENNHEIFTSVNEFNNVREKLEKLLGMPEQAQIIWQPENFIKIDDEKKAISILKLLETLDNCEDVQGVYSNFDIEDEMERTGIIGYITNFGQIPRQIFKRAHPERKGPWNSITRWFGVTAPEAFTKFFSGEGAKKKYASNSPNYAAEYELSTDCYQQTNFKVTQILYDEEIEGKLIQVD